MKKDCIFISHSSKDDELEPKIKKAIDQAVGNQETAEKARQKAIQLYLAYRRDGGENHFPGGRLCAWFEKSLQEQPPEEIEKQLNKYANDPKTHPSLKPLIPKLQTILAGYFDTGLADDPELYLLDAAEFLFLLEKLTVREDQ